MSLNNFFPTYSRHHRSKTAYQKDRNNIFQNILCTCYLKPYLHRTISINFDSSEAFLPRRNPYGIQRLELTLYPSINYYFSLKIIVNLIRSSPNDKNKERIVRPYKHFHTCYLSHEPIELSDRPFHFSFNNGRRR